MSPLNTSSSTTRSIASTSSSNKSNNASSSNKSNIIISGVLSGSLTSGILYPLDYLKTKIQANNRGGTIVVDGVKKMNIFQIIKNSYNQNGIITFYRGIFPSMVGSGIAWGLYFTIYNNKKQYYENIYGNNNIPSSKLVISSLYAGIISNLIIHPIMLIKTRLQLQDVNTNTINSNNNLFKEIKYKNSIDCFNKIIKYEGITSLYKGILPSMLLVSNGVIQLTIYDSIKFIYLKKYKNENLNTFESFNLGLISKIISTLSTYPLQVIKTRLQDKINYYHQEQYKNLLDAFLKIYKNEGFLSFYRGLSTHVLKVAPHGAILLMLNEQFLIFLNNNNNKI